MQHLHSSHWKGAAKKLKSFIGFIWDNCMVSIFIIINYVIIKIDDKLCANKCHN